MIKYLIFIMYVADYDKVWQEQIASFDHSSDLAEYWNGRAGTYDSVYRTSTYAAELMRRMDLSPDDSVLDIACGTGAVTIKLANKVRHVTALDISKEMLEILKYRAQQADLHNIEPVNRDWNRVSVGKDIAPHNIVLVSRSLPGARLSETLSKFNLACTRACYLTWRAERSDKYEVAVSRALGKHEHFYPDHRIIYETLTAMGIQAKTGYFESANEERFPSLDDAVSNMSRGKILTPDQANNLRQLAESRLSREDGYYYGHYKMKWALISWQKA